MERRRIIAAARGLTLIELLVVLGVIALASSVVVLSAPPARPAAELEATRFARAHDAAAAIAISSGAPIRFEVGADGYRLYRYDGAAWVLLDRPQIVRPHTLKSGVTASAQQSDPSLKNIQFRKADDDAPSIVIVDPIGAVGAASADFFDGADRWRVNVDSFGRARVEHVTG